MQAVVRLRVFALILMGFCLLADPRRHLQMRWRHSVAYEYDAPFPALAASNARSLSSGRGRR